MMSRCCLANSLCRRFRLWREAALLALCALLACACSGGGAADKVLAVSIPSQKWLLDSIVGDRFTVVSMLDAGSNPETFEPSMSQLMALDGSPVYFTVGQLDFEVASMPRIRENFPGLEIVESAQGVRAVESGHAHAHSGEDHDHHASGDPHVWTSLPNARVMARRMYEKVVELDPAGKDYYTARYRDLDGRLASLHDSVTRVLAPLRGAAFMVWHPSLSYFARDYGLRQISIETAGKESSPAQYREQLDKARNAAPLIFFTQAEFDPRQARSMAADLAVPTAPVSLMQPDLPAQIRIMTHELVQAAH